MSQSVQIQISLQGPESLLSRHHNIVILVQVTSLVFDHNLNLISSRNSEL